MKNHISESKCIHNSLQKLNIERTLNTHSEIALNFSFITENVFSVFVVVLCSKKNKITLFLSHNFTV